MESFHPEANVRSFEYINQRFDVKNGDVVDFYVNLFKQETFIQKNDDEMTRFKLIRNKVRVYNKMSYNHDSEFMYDSECRFGIHSQAVENIVTFLRYDDDWFE